MRSKILLALLAAVAAWRLGFQGPPVVAAEKAAATTSPSWSVNATAIEACSCPMFCQCYFNSKPAAHHDHGGEAKHYCRANLAHYKCPKAVDFDKELPREQTGKLYKRLLRDRYWGEKNSRIV